jgi:hypothetical protein
MKKRTINDNSISIKKSRHNESTNRSSHDNSKAIVVDTIIHDNVKSLVSHFIISLFTQLKDCILDHWSSSSIDTNEYDILYSTLKCIYYEPITFEIHGDDICLFKENMKQFKIHNELIMKNEQCANAFMTIKMLVSRIFKTTIILPMHNQYMYKDCIYNDELESVFNRNELVSDVITKIMYIGINMFDQQLYEDSLLMCINVVKKLILDIHKKTIIVNNKSSYVSSSDCSKSSFLIDILNTLPSDHYISLLKDIKPYIVVMKRKVDI